jgi:hypothetical protein
MKDKLDKVLTVFVHIWACFILLLNIIAIIGFFMAAKSFLDGWLRIADVYSPFNLANFAMEVISLSPALGALAWRDRRRKRHVAENNRRLFELAARAKAENKSAEAYQLPDGNWSVRLVSRETAQPLGVESSSAHSKSTPHLGDQ